MQAEQRQRLVALAAQVASETDAARFHALLRELNQLLEGNKHPPANNGKNAPLRLTSNEKL